MAKQTAQPDVLVSPASVPASASVWLLAMMRGGRSPFPLSLLLLLSLLLRMMWRQCHCHCHCHCVRGCWGCWWCGLSSALRGSATARCLSFALCRANPVMATTCHCGPMHMLPFPVMSLSLLPQPLFVAATRYDEETSLHESCEWRGAQKRPRLWSLPLLRLQLTGVARDRVVSSPALSSA